MKTAALATIMMILPISAQAFTAERGMPVADIGNSTFEVVARLGTGPKSYWCAAAQYARYSGATSGDRIFLVQGPGPSATLPNRTAVRFTTNPDAAGVAPLEPQSSLSVTAPGDNLSVAVAQQYCTQGLRRS